MNNEGTTGHPSRRSALQWLLLNFWGDSFGIRETLPYKSASTYFINVGN